MTLLYRFIVVTMGLAFLVTPGIPGNAQSQIFDDQEYENYYDPFYDPYFGTNGGYDYDDNFLTDRELRAEIMRDLEMSPFVDEDNIQVSVNKNIATLSGRVEDRSAMIDAVEIAYDAGAMRVRNQLNPRDRGDRPWVEMRDRELQEEIQDELWWSPFVNDDRIRVSVQDGVATLHGTVENKVEIADAVENAYEAGAKRVQSRLWVNPDLN